MGINKIIEWSVRNRHIMLLMTILITVSGVHLLKDLPLDAVPDLSEVQVIVRAHYTGHDPQVVEDQITYPLASAMLGTPGARVVRGYSFTGDAYIYIIFEDGTDPYWARSRVLESLTEIRERLPSDARIVLGPDASGVGWIYQYALIDRSRRHDLADLRSIQDWFMRYELAGIDGVAEVATVGGVEKTYEITFDPALLEAHQINYKMIKQAIVDASHEVSGSVIEMGESEYLLRGVGYLRGIDDIRRVPMLHHWDLGSVPRIGDISEVRVMPAPRRGIAELDGEGEVVGGIVVMQRGANALATIERVQAKLEQLKASLPEGVEIVETYNRADLIKRTVSTLSHRLVEEFIAVVLVCAVFLFHARSSLVILFSLPIGILAAFMVMSWQGITANIMSLGGIAIAIGAMVDATIVMIENVHKRLEGKKGRATNETIAAALCEVGRPLFISLIIITVSFMPIFALEAQEGRMFSPLAYTKTYAMAAAAGISITLVPALIAYLVRGGIRPELDNPINRWLAAGYKPMLTSALNRPTATIVIAILIMLSAFIPYQKLGVEFLPTLDEGDLLYMPSTLPSLSIGKAAELLQQTDRLIKQVPEVKRVFGKIGRADTATDPAPLTMIETTIQLHPREDWREGQTLDGIKEELNRIVKVPGLAANSWLMPIEARTSMLATGIRTPVGIKIAGPDLGVIEKLGQQVESIVRDIPGTKSAYAERVESARYINIEMDHESVARYGVSVGDVHEVVRVALGGETIAWTVEGRERYPVRMRMDRRFRDSVQRIKQIPVDTKRGLVALGDIAEFSLKRGPAMIKSENAQPNGWTYINIEGRDIGSWLDEARAEVSSSMVLPPGYSLTWSGQYEYLERISARLAVIIPLVIGLILVLLYINFGNLAETLMVMLALPLALVGGTWLLWILNFELSIAVAVGFIAVAGVAVEFGVVMLLYLDQAVDRLQPKNARALREAVTEGALLRLRPKAMTVCVIFAGLLPILIGSGAGSEVMKRIAAPMVGGMITAPLVSLIVIPVLYYIWQKRLIDKQ
ncbi:MAG: CusA/CzcA family heavy metal efflux RND transporter [Thiotrichaceae bacterium]|nr:MAG: CusA/CzcA family heavy metal efflux RND transporter [Thiotrichaceae bacterium]